VSVCATEVVDPSELEVWKECEPPLPQEFAPQEIVPPAQSPMLVDDGDDEEFEEEFGETDLTPAVGDTPATEQEKDDDFNEEDFDDDFDDDFESYEYEELTLDGDEEIAEVDDEDAIEEFDPEAEPDPEAGPAAPKEDPEFEED